MTFDYTAATLKDLSFNDLLRDIRFEICCAQQTGIGHVIVEALLDLSTNTEDQPRTYRHRETSDQQIVLPVPLIPVQLRFSAEVYEPANSNRYAAYSQQDLRIFHLHVSKDCYSRRWEYSTDCSAARL